MDIFTQVLFVWLAWVLLVVEDSGSSIWTHGWKVISNLNLVVKPWHPVTNHVISPGSPRRLPWQKCGDHLSQKRIGNGALDYFMYDVVSLLPWPVRTWETVVPQLTQACLGSQRPVATRGRCLAF